jgi:hypothetical protein
MSHANDLIRRCQELGIQLIPCGDKLKMKAAQPPPADLFSAIKESKREILAELKYRLHQDVECWILEEWRRISLPEWRHILQESIEGKNKAREEYARWMLREVLEDSDYREQP